MKVSLRWLQEYLPVDLESKNLLETLTMLGLEVDSAVDRFNYLADVVVGQVKDVKKDPEDGSLSLCKIDYGKINPVVVTTEARNIVVGSLVPVAMTDAIVSSGIIPAGRMRESFSGTLICTEQDLRIGSENKDVMLLSASAIIGQSMKEFLSLSDFMLEISLTPNRPDCASIIGIAREVAASCGSDLILPSLDPIKVCDSAEDSILVSVASSGSKDCLRYASRIFDNVIVAPSPFWLQDRLFSVGIRPINNVVDITNFVMMEMGQPLHSFDLDLLEGSKIIVRHLHKSEPFETLDGRKISLSRGMLTISDAKKPIAVAGIIGSLDSKVTGKTKRVVLESAYFSPASIRLTSKKLGIMTESSYRFERGTDPNGTIEALNRATNLMVELLGARLVGSCSKDEFPVELGANVIEFSVDKVNRILDIKLEMSQIIDFLCSVKFSVRVIKDGLLEVQVPSFRVDVVREEDLIEEVARLYGYRKIPTIFPKLGILNSGPGKKKKQMDTIKSVLNGLGFSEIISYSFLNVASFNSLRLPVGDFRRCKVDIVNPISSEQSILRTSLVPAILEAIRKNISNNIKDLMFFEIGKVFISRGKKFLPREIEMLVAIWTGFGIKSSWCDERRDCDFFDIKGALEGFLNHFGIMDTRFTKAPDSFCSYMRNKHTAQVLFSGNSLGLVGELDPDVLKNHSIGQRVFAFEIELDQFRKSVPSSNFISPVSRFPAVSRDATIIIDQGIETGDLLNRVKSLNEILLEDVYLIDVFHELKNNPNMKSISFRVIYRSYDSTLSDKIVNNIHAKLVAFLVEEFSALLPPS